MNHWQEDTLHFSFHFKAAIFNTCSSLSKVAKLVKSWTQIDLCHVVHESCNLILFHCANFMSIIVSPLLQDEYMLMTSSFLVGVIELKNLQWQCWMDPISMAGMFYNTCSSISEVALPYLETPTTFIKTTCVMRFFKKLDPWKIKLKRNQEIQFALLLPTD